MTVVIPDFWQRLPLAEAFWHFLREVWPPHRLDTLYDDHRGRSYEGVLPFHELVEWLCQAIIVQKGRLLPTLQQAGDLSLSIQAIYAKIRRMPREVSHALVLNDALQLRALATSQDRPPASMLDPQPTLPGLAGYRTLIFDGHSLKKASKRLKTVRGTPGRALGGKILAVLDRTSNLVIAMSSDPHAHVNEQALVPDVLKQVREAYPGPKLWVADRAFGNLANFKRCTADGDVCLLRKTIQSVFEAENATLRRGQDRRGRDYLDEVGLLKSSREGEQAARQITLLRPGLRSIVILTNLLDQDQFSADALLDCYADRWSIEAKFQSVSQLFTLGPYVSSHPDGILFQTALCLLLSNNLYMLQTLMAEVKHLKVEEVSTYKLFEDLREQLTATKVLLVPSDVEASLESRVPKSKSLWSYLQELLARAWKPSHRKSKRTSPEKPKSKHKRGHSGHFSIHRILNPKPKPKPNPKPNGKKKAKDV